jgi:hypothetical protein
MGDKKVDLVRRRHKFGLSTKQVHSSNATGLHDPSPAPYLGSNRVITNQYLAVYQIVPPVGMQRGAPLAGDGLSAYNMLAN